ncbi:MAG: tRNA(Ile)(2)-agmatinylcytidine synthase [Desulfurococcales archaeon]|nr:tRNA(Ile)(2)-agmatinylcytidine synthase [Desulfurococcales archaeon]
MTRVAVGFDDIDSEWGGCTTHLTGLFLYHIRSKVKLLDYPLLVRLNPNIPWKTRGNAATALHLDYYGDPRELYELAVWMVEEYTRDRDDWDVKRPGVIVYPGDPHSNPRLRWLYRKALRDVITIDVVRSILDKSKALYHGGRGIIGATAGIGALGVGEDYTFELIAYRRPEMIGEERCLLEDEAIRIESLAPTCTFNNVDWLTGRLAAAPRGPDPVLAGFRGDCPDMLKAYRRVLCEEPSFWVLYRSNQHTDPHDSLLTPRLTIYNTGTLKARITRWPRVISGGHVVVRASTEWGEDVDIIFYRETNPLPRIGRLLAPGDEVRVLGGVKPYTHNGVKTFAVEKLWVDKVATIYKAMSPRCPRCGSRMKSAGTGKGYKCPKCGYTDKNARSIKIRLSRELIPGVYTPKEGRLGHLVMPRWRSKRTDSKINPPDINNVVILE